MKENGFISALLVLALLATVLVAGLGVKDRIEQEIFWGHVTAVVAAFDGSGCEIYPEEPVRRLRNELVMVNTDRDSATVVLVKMEGTVQSVWQEYPEKNCAATVAAIQNAQGRK